HSNSKQGAVYCYLTIKLFPSLRNEPFHIRNESLRQSLLSGNGLAGIGVSLPGQQRIARTGIDQADGDAAAGSFANHTAFDDGIGAQLLPDVADIYQRITILQK